MNEAHDQDPFNNSSYGTLVDSPYKIDQPAGPRRPRLQRADHPRLRGRLGREGAARRPLAGPIARARRHGHLARLQQHRPRDSPLYPRELHRLHGLRDPVPRHGHPGQGALRGRARGEAGHDRRRRRSRGLPRRNGQGPRSTSTRPRRRGCRAGCSTSSSTPASARAAPSA